MFVFWICKEKVNLIFFDGMVDDSDAASLSPALRSPSYFPKPAAPPDDISRLGVERKSDLKPSEIGIIQEIDDLLREYRGFDELHIPDHTPLAHGCESVLFEFPACQAGRSRHSRTFSARAEGW